MGGSGNWAEKQNDAPPKRYAVVRPPVVDPELDWSVGDDVDQLAATAATELDPTISGGKQRVITPATHILAGVELRAPLTDDDAAGGHLATVVDLDSQTLCVGVAAVAGRPATLGL